MINENGETLVEHHTKYKEIHGVDETVWLTDSEHKKLHKKLRREGGCKIPVDELRRISKSAYARTEKGKHVHKLYRNSASGIEAKKKYDRSDKQEQTRNKYYRYNVKTLTFSDAQCPNISLYEKIIYNMKTGCVSFRSAFLGEHGYKMLTINI